MSRIFIILLISDVIKFCYQGEGELSSVNSTWFDQTTFSVIVLTIFTFRMINLICICFDCPLNDALLRSIRRQYQNIHFICIFVILLKWNGPRMASLIKYSIHIMRQSHRVVGVNVRESGTKTLYVKCWGVCSSYCIVDFVTRSLICLFSSFQQLNWMLRSFFMQKESKNEY